jgi:DNA-directed RNA polymerase specialized sigma54-like protein
MKNKIKSARAEIELLQYKSYELDDIIDRVDRSKPIFERMMTKVRKKEGQLKVSAERNTTKADRW